MFCIFWISFLKVSKKPSKTSQISNFIRHTKPFIIVVKSVGRTLQKKKEKYPLASGWGYWALHGLILSTKLRYFRKSLIVLLSIYKNRKYEGVKICRTYNKPFWYWKNEIWKDRVNQVQHLAFSMYVTYYFIHFEFILA